MQNRGRVTVVVGGQWGSEAKGLACQYLAKSGDYDVAVRTGAINAGHTVYDGHENFAMCQLPVAWVNQKVKLVIGAGAYVEPEVFDKELKMVDKRHKYGIRTKQRVFVDQRAYLHSAGFAEKEKGMHERMGSTAHGVGEAIKDKVERKDDKGLFIKSDYCKENNNELFQLSDTVKLLDNTLNDGNNVLVEGTQGTLLDIHLGIDYPYVTSRQTIASNWLAEAGLPPRNVETIMVLRTYPIRVAGNSGPMPGEMSWFHLLNNMNIRRTNKGLEPLVDPEAIKELELAENRVSDESDFPCLPYDMTPSQRVKYSTELSTFNTDVMDQLDGHVLNELKKVIEMTTVTKKVRRIGSMSEDLLRYSSALNRPDSIFLNFLNYKFAEIWGVTNWGQIDAQTQEEINAYLKHIEKVCQAPVRWVSTAPNTVLEVSKYATK